MSHRRIRLQKTSRSSASVTVAVSVALRAGDHHAHATLESVRAQRAEPRDPIDLVVVDDEAEGGAAGWALRWMRQYHERFNRLVFAEHVQPTGHGGAMRTALELSETDFVLELDTDLLLFPRCVARCLETIRESRADRVRPLVCVDETGSLDTVAQTPGNSSELWRGPTMWRARTWRDLCRAGAGWGGPSPEERLEALEPVSVGIPEILARRRFSRPSEARDRNGGDGYGYAP